VAAAVALFGVKIAPFVSKTGNNINAGIGNTLARIF
jgi:hypothetical protein